MANPYPIEIADAGDGSVKVAGKATFTDPANQPGGSQPQRNVGQAEYTFAVAVPTTEAVQTWVFSDGDAALLNLTDPTRPLPVVAGIYSVEVTYIRQPDSAAVRIRLLTDDDYYSINTIFQTPTLAPDIAPVVAPPWFWSAGSAAQLFVADNGETSGAGRILVQKIA
jgi:hypothetical protein